MDGSNTKRIVILGKTGAGKSSLANTIFGKNEFKIYPTANSGTSDCQAKTKSVNGRSITLIDTPGLFDTDRPEEVLKSHIVRCLAECAPGPHAFLIVLKMENFTEHEQAVINKIQQYFSEEVFKYSTVLFTHGDQLLDGQTVENYVQQNTLVNDLVKKCGGRCHVIDNRYWNKNTEDEYRRNQFQVEKLLNTIDKMVTKNNGGFYTYKTPQAVWTAADYGKYALMGTLCGVVVLTGVFAIRVKPKFVKEVVKSVGQIATAVVVGVLTGGAVGARTVGAATAAAAATGGVVAAVAGTTAAFVEDAKVSKAVKIIARTAAVGAVAGGVAGYRAAKRASQ